MTNNRYFLKCRSCGEKAFEFMRKPYPGMEMKTSEVIHRDNIQQGEIIHCQECKADILNINLQPRFLLVE